MPELRERTLDTLRNAGAFWNGSGRPRKDWYPYGLEPSVKVMLGELLESYRDELLEVDRMACEVLPRIRSSGGVAQLADLEAELLYVFLRLTRPESVFEISPAYGWSTNHILAALTRNEHGRLHSFELMDKTADGTPIEAAIRRNLHPELDAQRLELHIGDAQEEAATVGGAIDFLFLDSAHEAWFAEWYEEDLLPRTRGVCFIHDIIEPRGMPKHERYFDGEAYAVLEWLEREGVRAVSAASLEESIPRGGNARRLDVNSFAVLFTADAPTKPPRVRGRPRAMLRGADLAVVDGDLRKAVEFLAEALALADRETPHLTLQIGERWRRLGAIDEARRLARAVAEGADTHPLWLFQAGRTLSLLGVPLEGRRLMRNAARHEDAPRWLREMHPPLARRLGKKLRIVQ